MKLWQALALAAACLMAGYGFGLSDNFHWAKFEYELVEGRNCK